MTFSEKVALWLFNFGFMASPPRPPSKPQKVYFVYYRKPDNKPFYLDAHDQTTTWRFPTDGVVYDPVTKKPVKRTQQVSPSMIRMGRRATASPASISTLMTEMRAEKDLEIEWIPPTLEPDSHKNTPEEMAEKFFKLGKGADATELAKFQPKKISAGLLSSLDKSHTKKAVKMFKMILQYIGIEERKKPVMIDDIMAFANENGLIDELYAQIIKESHSAPEKQIDLVARLLAVVSAVQLPSPDLVPFIRSQIARMSNIERVRSMMVFAYFRFNALVDSGVSHFHQCRGRDLAIACDVATLKYGVSLYEVMWNQRKNHPGLPIPYILLYTHRVLMEKECTKTQGIFRLPGNMGLLEQLIVDANQSDEGYLEAALVNDVGSFYKRWFRDIPGGLINRERTEQLLKTKKDAFVEFADALEPLHRNVLMHLIGFLRELAKYSETTMMDEANLAMVFGPNIICADEDADPLLVSRLSSTSSGLISALIERWDVSSIYPFQGDAAAEKS